MNEDLKRWDNIAKEWIDNKESKLFFKAVLVNQAIAELMPDLVGKIVLDAGCGDGEYSKVLKSRGAEIIGVDGPGMIEIANRINPGIEYRLQDLMEPWQLEDKSFDYIFCCMVLIQLSDLKVFLSEAKRTLKDQGALILSVSHPCFTEPVTSLYRSWYSKITGGKVLGLVKNYFIGPQKERKWTRGPKGRSFYPRTLETYFKELKSAGFRIDDLREPNELPPEFLSKYPEYEYVTRIPRFLFIKATKQ